jgi:hypothetical protein
MKLNPKMKSKIILYLALVLSGNCHAAIIYPKAPDGGQRLVYEFTSFFVKKNLPPFKGLSIEDLTIAAPYQSYSVGLTNLAAGELLSAVNLGIGGGWKYPVMHGTNAVGWAFVRADDKTGKAVKCAQLGESRLCNEMLESLRIAERLPQVKKQDFELRSLDMPWIFFSALWLHGKSDDIIIPLPDNWGRWNAFQPFSENEVIKFLKPIAQKELKKKRMPGMVD